MAGQIWIYLGIFVQNLSLYYGKEKKTEERKGRVLLCRFLKYFSTSSRSVNCHGTGGAFLSMPCFDVSKPFEAKFCAQISLWSLQQLQVCVFLWLCDYIWLCLLLTMSTIDYIDYWLYWLCVLLWLYLWLWLCHFSVYILCYPYNRNYIEQNLA